MAKGLKYRALFTALAGLLYGVSPIDVIPDIIPLLGLVDDAVVVPTLLLLAFFHFKKGQRMEKREATIPAGRIIDIPNPMQTPPRSRVM